MNKIGVGICGPGMGPEGIRQSIAAEGILNFPPAESSSSDPSGDGVCAKDNAHSSQPVSTALPGIGRSGTVAQELCSGGMASSANCEGDC